VEDLYVPDILFRHPPLSRRLPASHAVMAVTTDEKPDLASWKPSDAHRMRITSAGSIASYVRFALSFLQVRSASQYRRLLTPHQTNPGRPLILHTYPPSPSATSADTPSKASSSTLTPCLLTTPKLISVVEITKRRYISQLEASKSGKGKNRATGIWQYTESGLSPVPTTARSSDDGGDLTRVLEGKTKSVVVVNMYTRGPRLTEVASQAEDDA